MILLVCLVAALAAPVLSEPSMALIDHKGYPDEWIPIVVVGGVLTLIMLVINVKVLIQHKKYSVKNTMQFICTIGILQVYPLFCICYFIGTLIPKSLAVMTFFAETYEAMTFIFFLRLLLTYIGGKKELNTKFKGTVAHLNVPPCCCLCCLPHVHFSKKFYKINEFLLLQFGVYQIVFGFIDMMVDLDESGSTSSTAPNGSTTVLAQEFDTEYTKVYHALFLVSLLLAIYGLGGIYHAAEAELMNKNIFKKFIVYKVPVSLAKLQDVFVQIMISEGGFGTIKYGAFGNELRATTWFSLLTIVECFICFLLAIHWYSPKDYPASPDHQSHFSPLGFLGLPAHVEDPHNGAVKGNPGADHEAKV